MTSNTDEQFEDRLGRKFKNPELLQRALTHSSAIPDLRAADAKGLALAQDNEQLEFLGDAVLNLLACGLQTWIMAESSPCVDLLHRTLSLFQGER